MNVEKIKSLPDDFIEMKKASFAEGFEFLDKMEKSWSSGENKFNKQGEVLFVAIENGKTVGICGLNIDPYTDDQYIGRVRHLYIMPSARRKGLARKLVGAVTAHAENHFDILRLRTNNPEACKFYENLGFSASNRDYETHYKKLKADPIFEDPKLVDIYDHFDGERNDLHHYVNLIKLFNVDSIIDVGSGTGCLTELLVKENFNVVAVEPAKASLEYAKRRVETDKVKWLLGDTKKLSDNCGDLAVMTGNVAEVFTTDVSWQENLNHIRRALKPKGYLVFETRDPAKQAWKEWNKDSSFQIVDIPNVGGVEGWVDVLNVADELVTFRWTYRFQLSGEVLSSDSTIRFRSRASIVDSLQEAGFDVLEVRDAPDRPGKEFVFIAQLREK